MEPICCLAVPVGNSGDQPFLACARHGSAFFARRMRKSALALVSVFVSEAQETKQAVSGINPRLPQVAMLLKRRIAVYCDDLPRLLGFMRTLPLLVWHRHNYDVLRCASACPLLARPLELVCVDRRGLSLSVPCADRWFR